MSSASRAASAVAIRQSWEGESWTEKAETDFAFLRLDLALEMGISPYGLV